MKRHLLSVALLTIVFLLMRGIEDLIVLSFPGKEIHYIDANGQEMNPGLFYIVTTTLIRAGISSFWFGIPVATVLWLFAWQIFRFYKPTGKAVRLVLFPFIGLCGGALLSLCLWLILGGWSPPALLGFAVTGATAFLWAGRVSS